MLTLLIFSSSTPPNCFVCKLPILSHQVGLIWQGGNGVDDILREQMEMVRKTFSVFSYIYVKLTYLLIKHVPTCIAARKNTRVNKMLQTKYTRLKQRTGNMTFKNVASFLYVVICRLNAMFKDYNKRATF